MRIPDINISSRKLSQQKPLQKGTDVRFLQQMLKYLDFYKGRVDGIFGFQTKIAVLNFQKAFKTKPTGIIDDTHFEILQNLRSYNIEQWNTPRKGFDNTGYFPTPLPSNLNTTAKKNIKDIIGITAFANILIITAKTGIYAFNLDTSKLLWKNTKVLPKAEAIVQNYKAYIPSEELTILDALTGKKLITFPGNFTQPVAVENSTIYAPTDGGRLLALKNNGSLKWQYDTQSALCTTPALANNLIYFSAFDRSAYCLDKKGIPYWKQKLPDITKIPPALWQNKFYIISVSGDFVCLDSFTGDILWQKKFPDEEYLPPAFFDDNMVVTDIRGNIYCVDTKDGDLCWAKDIRLPITSSPITCPTCIFLGTDTGLWTYDKKADGKVINLEGHTIKAMAYTRFDLFVATDKQLMRISP